MPPPAAGMASPEELNRHHIYRRVFMNQVTTFEDIFPPVALGSMRAGEITQKYRADYERAHIDSWK